MPPTSASWLTSTAESIDLLVDTLQLPASTSSLSMPASFHLFRRIAQRRAYFFFSFPLEVHVCHEVGSGCTMQANALRLHNIGYQFNTELSAKTLVRLIACPHFSDCRSYIIGQIKRL